MPDVTPSRERAHLLLAATRVAEHREGRPPAPPEIAALLDWSVEETLAVIRGLAEKGILLLHETPFELRVEIGDHLQAEDLPAEADKAALRGEVDEFKRKTKKRRDELDRMFTSGEAEKKRQEAVEDLAADFEKFRKKGRQPPT